MSPGIAVFAGLALLFLAAGVFSLCRAAAMADRDLERDRARAAFYDWTPLDDLERDLETRSA